MPDSDSDLLDSIIARAQKGSADRLDHQMRGAREIKAKEEEASRRRLEEMWMREHDRQRAIADAEAEQRRQEQTLVRYVLMGAAAIILILIILTFVLNQPGP